MRHFANLPSEEVFTTPDPRRTNGHVTATKPLALNDGSIVRGLTVRFLLDENRCPDDSFPLPIKSNREVCMQNYDIRYDDKYSQLAQIDIAQGVTIHAGVLHHPRAHGRTVLPMVEPATVIPTGND